MSTLEEKLLGERRGEVEAECVQVIEAEVASKKGFSGAAVKAAFAMIKKFKPDIVPDAVGHLLPDFVRQLEPLYAEHQAQGGGDVAAHMTQNADRLADALIEITDERAKSSKHGILVKAYNSLRPQGKKQVMAAAPRLGGLLAKFGC